jgi:uncharacterized protein
MALDATVILFGSALVAGLLSSPHCVGMCGSVMAAAHNMRGARPASAPSGTVMAITPVALTPSATPSAALPISAAFSGSLAFNAGRIASYVLAGAIAGFVSSNALSVGLFGDAMAARTLLYVAGQLQVIIMGLYIAGWSQVLVPLERLGRVLWRHISPIAAQQLARSASAPSSLRGQFTLGVLWGWIPCGLVYAMLASALASQQATSGALTMLGFGLGTLPAMMLVGVSLAKMRAHLQDKGLRLIIGAIFIAVGAVNLSHATGFSKLSAYGMVCHQLGLPPSGSGTAP